MARIELSNIGGGGGTLSLTTTGTSGAATLAGSVLNIPIYQGQLTLTTTGTSGAATLSGDVLNIPQYSGGGGTPAGSTGEIQYNNAGAFGASSNLAWDNSNVRLNVGAPSVPSARFNVKGSGSLSATSSAIFTNNLNSETFRIIDDGQLRVGGSTSGILGVSGTTTPTNPLLRLVSTGSEAGVLKYMDFTLRANGVFSVQEGTSSNTRCLPIMTLYGTGENGVGASIVMGTNSSNDIFSAGNAIAGFQVRRSNDTNPISNANCWILKNWTSVLMTINASGNTSFGNFTSSIDARLHVRGANTTAGVGAFLVQNNRATPDDIYRIDNDGKISYLATNTAAGTTGAQTINRPSGTVNFAIGAGSLVVTNSLCTTSSIVFATVRTNDATAYIKNVVPAAGSFTINLGANATAETSVGFFIIN